MSISLDGFRETANGVRAERRVRITEFEGR